MTNGEALAQIEAYARENMGYDNPQGKMLEILTELTDIRNSRIGLDGDILGAYNVAMSGFRALLAPKEGVADPETVLGDVLEHGTGDRYIVTGDNRAASALLAYHGVRYRITCAPE